MGGEIPKCMLGGGGGGPVIPKCMLGYNRTHNMHANSITCNKNLCTVLVPLCENNLNLPISHTDHYTLREYKQLLPEHFKFSTQ